MKYCTDLFLFNCSFTWFSVAACACERGFTEASFVPHLSSWANWRVSRAYLCIFHNIRSGRVIKPEINYKKERASFLQKNMGWNYKYNMACGSKSILARRTKYSNREDKYDDLLSSQERQTVNILFGHSIRVLSDPFLDGQLLKSEYLRRDRNRLMPTWFATLDLANPSVCQICKNGCEMESTLGDHNLLIVIYRVSHQRDIAETSS